MKRRTFLSVLAITPAASLLGMSKQNELLRHREAFEQAKAEYLTGKPVVVNNVMAKSKHFYSLNHPNRMTAFEVAYLNYLARV